MNRRILVIAESDVVFHKYFSNQVFIRLQRPIIQDLRGRSDSVLIRFGRYWRSIEGESHREILDYCYYHNIVVIDLNEGAEVLQILNPSREGKDVSMVSQE